jgi:thiol-disulfide isomerase/thioredoxin
MAPGFELPVLGSDRRVALEAFRGRLVYLDFWASWCGPCRKSLPFLAGLAAEVDEQEFAIVAVNVDQRGADAHAFLDRHPVPYTVLADPDGQVARAYQLPGMPTSFLIGPDGTILWRHVGFRIGDEERVRARVLEALGRGG